ncbi:hypothetical protein [Streptomyces sp. NPDC127119]|uniref:hypothetical protein n=1 Tax=Streptomyces sp. NPDC127119 TaxID=3345370 RepID=UPI003636D32D
MPLFEVGLPELGEFRLGGRRAAHHLQQRRGATQDGTGARGLEAELGGRIGLVKDGAGPRTLKSGQRIRVAGDADVQDLGVNMKKKPTTAPTSAPTSTSSSATATYGGTSSATATSSGSTVSVLYRLALLHQGRARLLVLTTLTFMAHEACEALIPVLVGVVVDRALAPGDPSALAGWLAVLAATFVLLSWSWQRASAAMVSVYGHGEHALRQGALRRVLDPHGGPPRLLAAPGFGGRRLADARGPSHRADADVHDPGGPS